MKKLEKIQRYIKLYDAYKNLLTERQRIIFELYYFEDLSFSEIAKMHNISRIAVYESLKNVEKKLVNYQDKLSLGMIFN